MRNLTNSILDKMIKTNVNDVIESLRIYSNVIGWSFDDDDDLIVATDKTEYILGITDNRITFWMNRF